LIKKLFEKISNVLIYGYEGICILTVHTYTLYGYERIFLTVHTYTSMNGFFLTVHTYTGMNSFFLTLHTYTGMNGIFTGYIHNTYTGMNVCQINDMYCTLIFSV
jgi:hypothetical protein